MTETEARRLLAVPPSASDRQVKAAWRRAVQQSHPDRHPGDLTARRRFLDIQEAHRVLTDPALIAARAAARRRAPEPPFSVLEVTALRTLGLGPGASYDDIEAHCERLRDDPRNGPAALAARDLLMATRPSDPDAPDARPETSPAVQRGPLPPPRRASRLAMALCLVIALICLGALVALWLRLGGL